jgi:hypothetical protein
MWQGIIVYAMPSFTMCDEGTIGSSDVSKRGDLKEQVAAVEANKGLASKAGVMEVFN